MTIQFSLDPATTLVTTSGEGFLVRTQTDEAIARDGACPANMDLVSDVARSHPMISARWWKYEDYQTKEAAFAAYPDLIDNT